MMRILRHALLPAVIAALSLSTSACKESCKDGVCTLETTQGYVGTPVDQAVPWSAGMGVQVNVKGGNVRIGSQAETSITVSQGSDPANIIFRFTPINNETKENEAKAKQEMGSPDKGGNLVLSASSANGVAVASVTQSGTHSSGLSATVDVLVPAGFDGDITAITEYGSISIGKATKAVTATTGHGAVQVDVAAAPPPASAGNISSDFGDLILNMPASAGMAIKATANDGTVTDTLPGTWMEAAGSVANSKTVQPAAGVQGGAADWVLTARDGNVVINVR